MTTIEKLDEVRSGEPYNKTLRVKVVKVSPHGWSQYVTASGQASEKLLCMLADSTGHIRCEVFGDKDAPSFKEGNSIALRNYIVNSGIVRVTSQTRVLRHSDLAINLEVTEGAKRAFNEPLSPVKAITSAKKSPVKSKISFSGSVITDEAVRTVRSKGSTVAVRNLTVSDQSGVLRVALWQGSSAANVSTGSRVTIKDATLNYNSEKDEYTASVNDINAIEVAMEKLVQKTITIGAIKICGQHVELLEDTEDVDYEVPLGDLLSEMGATTFEDCLNLLPHTCTCIILGDKIIEFRSDQAEQVDAPEPGPSGATEDV